MDLLEKNVPYCEVCLTSNLNIMELVNAFKKLPLRKLYPVSLYCLGLKSDYTQLYRTYKLSLLLSSIYSMVYKPSKLVGLVTMALTVSYV